MDLSPGEADSLEADLIRTIDYVKIIERFDGEIPALDMRASRGKNKARLDVPEKGLSREAAMRNAPETDGPFFKAPPNIKR